MGLEIPSSINETVAQLKDVLWGGVDFNYIENGGPDCVARFDAELFFTEFCCMAVVAVGMWLCCVHFSSTTVCPDDKLPEHKHAVSIHAFLGIVTGVILGIELGFKCSTRTMVFILNPCHMCIIIQLILLATPPSHWKTHVFRWHIALVGPAFFALLQPQGAAVRMLHCEAVTYFLEHIIIVFNAYILPQTGGFYSCEPVMCIRWTIEGLLINLVYHYALLGPLAIWSTLNLDNMLCGTLMPPPLQSEYYRPVVSAVLFILIPIYNKSLTWCTIYSPLVDCSFLYTCSAPNSPPKNGTKLCGVAQDVKQGESCGTKQKTN